MDCKYRACKITYCFDFGRVSRFLQLFLRLHVWLSNCPHSNVVNYDRSTRNSETEFSLISEKRNETFQWISKWKYRDRDTAVRNITKSSNNILDFWWRVRPETSVTFILRGTGIFLVLFNILASALTNGNKNFSMLALPFKESSFEVSILAPSTCLWKMCKAHKHWNNKC